jgi:hypothetical protein
VRLITLKLLFSHRIDLQIFYLFAGFDRHIQIYV